MTSSSSGQRQVDTFATTEQILNRLAEVCTKISQCDYTTANELFSYTIAGKYPGITANLAESFGMMLVKLEAREYQLGKTIAKLDETCRQLTLGSSTLRRENKKLRESLISRHVTDKIVGNSKSVATLLRQVERAAQVDATVLITGETGTGKGLLARRLHYGGSRAKGPFVAINCAAIPSSLLESELFGIEKGVASGVDARIGRFEQANNGTLFLDEIGDMPLESQAKILHVIENASVERIGGRRPVPINVRIVAATHRDLAKACEEGAFRSDLYYRLNVIRLYIPALRERREDISLLAEHFLRQCAAKAPIVPRCITPQALRILQAYAWPGNIRELENEIERAALLSMNEGITPQDLSPGLVPLDTDDEAAGLFIQAPELLPPHIFAVDSASSSPEELEKSPDRAVSPGQGAPASAGPDTDPPHDSCPVGDDCGRSAVPSLDSAEKELIARALEQSRGNKSSAARMLGISREGLRKKLKRLGLTRTPCGT